jgi:hypothetical protein
VGFLEARQRVVECLEAGDFSHWPRHDLLLKNWLAVDRITRQEVIQMLRRCKGTQHRPGKQISPADSTVHEFFPVHDGAKWYIKVYLDEEGGPAVIEAVFMSVHPSGV